MTNPDMEDYVIGILIDRLGGEVQITKQDIQAHIKSQRVGVSMIYEDQILTLNTVTPEQVQALNESIGETVQ